MKKQLFLYLNILLLCVACEKKQPKAIPSDKAIAIKVNELYTKYGQSNEAIYNQPVPDDLFSQDLKKALEDAIKASKADIEKVKSSDHPDEKPLVFEGAIFSSLYEGFTSYKIKSVTIKDKRAQVLVAFEYNMASPKVTWSDTIHLTDTEKGWRIDNITFDKTGNSKDLAARLTDFVQSTR
ncbi:MAG: hypothetical protein MUW56_00130 [Chryseobacterium sp.]|uniref:hypothetical protein n=1 Tax=Chryseobacterium sp. TaxID=1871047 RepID=UPI0025B8379F|nr:hypothetical protein [Chryseobacterium sp.]MCJ7932070.1 hypothetical protein [Chryseobacterium sp.]